MGLAEIYLHVKIDIVCVCVCVCVCVWSGIFEKAAFCAMRVRQ